nr:hypothetical protein [Tanacetum cinerariifolium]
SLLHLPNEEPVLGYIKFSAKGTKRKVFGMPIPGNLITADIQDEQWFYLTKDTLRDALEITPVNNIKAFSSPSSSDAVINFVNKLGYAKLVRNLSNVIINDMFEPW